MATSTRRDEMIGACAIGGGALVPAAVPKRRRLPARKPRTVACPPATPLSTWGADRLVSTAFDLQRPNDGWGMWSGRSRAVLTAVTRALVSMRDTGRMTLDAVSYRDAMALPNVEAMAEDGALDADTRERLGQLLASLPATGDRGRPSRCVASPRSNTTPPPSWWRPRRWNTPCRSCPTPPT